MPKAVMVLIVYVIFLAVLISSAKSQEHEHGKDGVPTWYDADCCDYKDCRPVPDDEVEEVAPDKWLHKPTGLTYENEGTWRRVRDTKDGRFHVCFAPELNRGEWTGGYVRYCIYVKRTMA